MFHYVFVQWLPKVSGGQWRLSLGDKRLKYCHPTLMDDKKTVFNQRPSASSVNSCDEMG